MYELNLFEMLEMCESILYVQLAPFTYTTYNQTNTMDNGSMQSLLQSNGAWRRFLYVSWTEPSPIRRPACLCRLGYGALVVRDGRDRDDDGARQVGQDARVASHASTQAAWNPWPHAGSTRTRTRSPPSRSSSSARQMAHSASAHTPAATGLALPPSASEAGLGSCACASGAAAAVEAAEEDARGVVDAEADAGEADEDDEDGREVGEAGAAAGVGAPWADGGTRRPRG
jgi:hypothetical protein